MQFINQHYAIKHTCVSLCASIQRRVIINRWRQNQLPSLLISIVSEGSRDRDQSR
jgi:6-phosphogluconate dehydrogenase